MSDHCPLLLVNEGLVRKPRRFRFEEYWRFLTGFNLVVAAAWNLPVGSLDPISCFNIKLRRVGKALSVWSKNVVGNLSGQFDLVHDLTARLDEALDSRPLSIAEAVLRSRLKSRHLGLAVLLRIKQKQRARVRWLRASDANSKLFHIKANSRARKNQIHSLAATDGSKVVQQEQMLNLVSNHFRSILGSNSWSGFQCKVSWLKVCSPRDLGGLGLPNMQKFGSALRLRWLWLRWADSLRPWTSLLPPCSVKEYAMFASATSAHIGDSSTALFWFDAWLEGVVPRDLAHSLFAISSRKRRTVAAALHGDAWLQDISTRFRDGMMEELIYLSSRLQNVSLQLGVKDSITWKLTSSGVYSAKSAYLMLFSG
ncbi:hypothetical protein D1007_03893 [Hordeum vulgare]|nr:hypothetical protein D1007_03893 [Hordeum vulgare]